MPKKLLLYRLKTLLAISLAWIVFGIVFFNNLIIPGNDLGIKVSLFQFCFTFGLCGLIISAALIFYLKPKFNHLPLWLSMVIKMAITFLLFFVIAYLLLLFYYFFESHKYFNQFFHDFFANTVHTNAFTSFMIDMGLMTLLSILLLEITDKYGPGMFWTMLKGEYHQPKIENRIIIFLDINESTSIAEQLGHEKYFRMLRNFFNDITIPVMANDGEIYQYVGDEMVLSWLNTPENKIKSLKFIRNTFFLMERLSGRYEKKYGKKPTFKAGIHAGEITAGFIGVVKKDLIYCGDTMNTTARIRSMCNELNESYIISEDFMHDFHQPFGYDIQVIGKMELKGRSEEVKLFSLQLNS
jgi:adenylate cyclase